MTSPPITRVTIRSIGNRTVVVRLEGGGEELWKLENLPAGVQVGATVAVRVVDGKVECWVEQATGSDK